MKVVDLLHRLREAGIELWAEGEKLRFSAPPGALTDELRAALREHRDEVLDLLSRASAAPETAEAITPAARGAALPLSYQQRRMWFFEQVHPGTSTYHMTASWRIGGRLDTAALERSFHAVAARHENLRVRFAVEGDEPVQVVDDRVHLPLPVIDLTAVAESARAAELQEHVAAESTRPFDLSSGPLLRTTLLRTGEEEHVLVVVLHHIVGDMWSVDLLLKEITVLYRAGGLAADARLPELPVQYPDFAVWQRTRPADDRLAHWTRALAGAPTLLELPTDRPRPTAPGHLGAQESLALPADLIAELDRLCRAAGATRFMALLAAFHVLLSRYTGESDTLVGSPVAGRTRAEVENLIGFFVNTVVLRADLADDPTFTELLARVRDGALGAFEHQEIPVEQVVEAVQPRRDPARPPLFQALFVVQNTSTDPLDLPGLVVEPLDSSRVATEFDLTLEFTESDGEPRATVLYNAEVFHADTMRRLLGHWRRLLRAVVADPGRRVGELPLLDEEERHLSLDLWNATARDHSRAPVHERISRQAALTPHAPAVVFRGRRLDYAGLDAAAGRLAARVRAAGVSADQPVAVCVERSPEMVVSLIGVLRASACYLPVDAALPPERLAYMLSDAGVRVVVTTAAQRHRFDGFPVQVVLVDDDRPAPENPEPVDSAPGDLAYVIYTSGSTGQPKGVTVEHRSLANFLSAMDEVIGADGDPGVWLAVTSMSFDIAALELLWPLTRGWTVFVQDDGDVLPGAVTQSPAATRPLDFSLFYFAVGGDGDDPYRLLLDGARFADTHDFCAVWTPERHFAPFGGPYPNPSVTSAALAVATERVQIRAGSVVLPLHHPARVAEEWAVVDHLSKGRVGLSFASGWHADDFALAPDPSVFERRRDTMREHIETVRRLWRGEAVQVRNGAGNDIGIHTFPRPVRSELPVWLAAAGSPDTFRAAGEAGAGLLTHLLGQNLEELEQKISLYREAWKAAGHDGDGHVVLMVHTYIGSDAADVRETVRAPFRAYLRQSFGLVRSLAPSLGIDGEPTEQDVEALLDHAFEQYYDGGAMMGTVAQCTAMAERIRAVGVDELACLIDFGVPTEDVLASLPLLDTVRRRFAAAEGAAEEADYGVAAQIERHGVTHLQCTPSLASVLTTDPGTERALRRLDTLVIGGEALPPALAAQLSATAGRVLNMYGPTETTIWSTSWTVADLDGGVSIGTPIANTRVYVLDGRLAPVPVGVPGELWIGGHGVARGYLNRPELTAERFRPSPFVDGDTLYRTGDRVRWRADGRIEFLGRVDRQIKLGGHRIELGEIEAALREHPALVQAAVIAHTDAATGHRRLAAYVVTSGARPSPAELRTTLLRRIPEVMVPTTLIWLDGLPLNSSGKVDYRALPDPGSGADERSARTAVTSHEYVAPADDTERAIVGIWQDVLSVDQVGTTDNFFELGGHSLMAIQMVSRLRAALNKEVTLRTVFESATVADLAQGVRALTGEPAADAVPTLVPAPRDGAVPLSFAQQRMWFFELMNPGTASYHLSAALRLRGPLQPWALRRAFADIVRRHEILRTSFTEVDGIPMQSPSGPREIPLPLVDLSGLPEDRRRDTMLELAHREARLLFDLEADPLLRTTLLRTEEQEHVLLLTTHHIVADSWSIGVMAAELGVLYDAHCAGRPAPLPELAVQYADFTLWQQSWLDGPAMERQLDYWRRSLAGAPPVLELPYDRPRAEIPTHRGEQVVFTLSPELSDGLKTMSLRQDVTVFVTLLTSFMVLLHRWSAEEHIVLGVPVGGRNVPELEPLIGFFANITVLHTDLSGEPTFAEVLRRVRETVIGAYDHQDLPVEKLVADLGVDRTLAHNPLFQVMFVYTNDLALSPALGGLEVAPLDVHPGDVFMDLNMAMEDGPDGLRGTLDYSTELFDAETVERLLASFQELLAAVVAEPSRPIGALPPAGPERRTANFVEARETEDAASGADDGASAHLPLVVAATFTAGPVEQSLTYWADRTGLPLAVEFAPYNQVFQQLLDPASATAVNEDGVNAVLLRVEDWVDPDGSHTFHRAVVDEFLHALAAFQENRPTPLVVVLCPAAEEWAAAHDAWRARLLTGLAEIGGAVCLDMEPMLELYEVGDFSDPISEQAGRIPYTDEFFAVLGTCLARQVSALVGDYPKVVVLDGTPFPSGPGEPAGEMLTASALALAEQGRSVYVCTSPEAVGPEPGGPAGHGVTVWTDGRPPAQALDAACEASGATLKDCLYLSADPAHCADVRAARPHALVLEHPEKEEELAAFLEHTWLFDRPGAAVEGAFWWGAPTR
ncbi:MupA/Atu3671 family FMN-dependent luciferase-like monooxygenase [Streptomyces sp. P17]|uniref:MupA/Atu3671 family FMN-dependent luciferase-like monooxygenase n=1 Tax=Streptomyces sp. P17 TaxID=3074716 RepID=UPI0028F3F593|nr:MupA/Atu3671 family FMN-dependent luciferase-like monooxygenase [Streptomyces sp. P17]MDT9701393.1 LLM class flavin-dependent oxidoreductase [Streptomyces sp. P17]